MHAVDQILLQLDVTTAQCKEAISEKKLHKGEGGWSQHKVILGWMLDTSSHGTLKLTEHHSKQILNIFKELHHKNRVGLKKWQ